MPNAFTSPPRSAYAAKLRNFPDLAFADEEAFQFRGRWDEFFRGRLGPAFDGRVVFEIGCFDATLLARLATRHPKTGFVGLDWKCKAIHDAATHVAATALRNVALLRGRGQDVSRVFGDGEVDEVLLFHPDPCDRDVELKNRLFAEPFLLDVHRVLRDASSTLSLKTDHPGYYQWALGLLDLPEPPWFADSRDGSTMRATPRVRARDLMRRQDLPRPSDPLRDGFDVTCNSADFWNDPAVLAHTSPRCFAGDVTTFESRFLRRRLPIYYVELRKK